MGHLVQPPLPKQGITPRSVRNRSLKGRADVKVRKHPNDGAKSPALGAPAGSEGYRGFHKLAEKNILKQNLVLKAS